MHVVYKREKVFKMVSRNLTEVFILMRNNSIQSRQLYNEQVRSIKETVDFNLAILMLVYNKLLVFYLRIQTYHRIELR